MNRSFLLVSCLIVLLGLGSSLGFSEIPEHDSIGSPSEEGKKKRPPVTDRLSEEELNFLSEAFFRDKSSLLDRFDSKKKHPDLFIPEGITAVQKDPASESTLAKVLAELSGSLNDKQLNNLGAESKTLASSIRGKDPSERDSRLLSLVERSEWLTSILKGETPPSDSLPQAKDEKAYQSFRKEFLEALKEVNKKNKEILELMDEAKNGNTTAKNTLRQKLDMKSLPTFLKAQSEWGGKELFEKTAEALVHIDKEGYRYHDFRDADGRSARVVAGKTAAEHVGQLSDFFKKSPERLAGYSLASRPITSGNPELINLTGKPVAPPKPPKNSGSSSSTTQSSLAKLAVPIFKAKCAECHKNNAIPIRDFSLAVQLIRAGEMPPPEISISPQEKETLLRYLQSSEDKAGLAELTQ